VSNLFCALALSLAALAQDAAAPALPDVDPKIAALLSAISPQRLGEIVAKLQSFETRNTLSAQDSPTRGIGAAAQWIFDELQRSSPRLEVSFDTYEIPKQGERIVRDVRLRNVMAVLKGKSERRIYVSGHYDSVARVPRGSQPAARESGGSGGDQGTAAGTPPLGSGSGEAAGRAPGQEGSGGFDWGAGDLFAPGANDDASGTALVMELARVFATSDLQPEATLVFIAFAGEEQGLVGAKLHAQKAEANKLVIDAMLNNDIIGNSVGGNGVVNASAVRVFSEGPEDSPSRQLARFVARQAARYLPGHEVRLIARHDRFGRGGDHTAFNAHGYAGVRLSEANENFERQHSQQDTADGVDPAYLARNARVNAAAAATLALAPPAPRLKDDRGRQMLDRRPSGYDARLRWQASPGAVAYRVFWRNAWTPDWQHELLVGNVTEAILAGVSIDDGVFGVAAIGPGGHESLVAAYVNAPRPEVPIKTK
jgi:hypothetical protein